MGNHLAFQLREAPGFLNSTWPVIFNQARTLKHEISSGINQILFCGCGDSYHAAYGLQYAASGYLNLPSHGLNAMEAARFWIPDSGKVNESSLVIGISASGEVARTLESIEQAKRVGALTLGITCDPESTLANTSDLTISTSLPEMPVAPGLLSYLSSVLMGFSVISVLSNPESSNAIEKSIDRILEGLPEWINHQRNYVDRALTDFNYDLPLVYLASGPAYGSAMFASAKYIEAVGKCSWAQDVEEWAHLEYFCDPSELPIWLLSVEGRSFSREQEVLQAANAIGRKILISQWNGLNGNTDMENDIYSPLVLWVGPFVFADRSMLILDEKPFRDFSGGRSSIEGGGASRIRSSWRIETRGDWKQTTDSN